MSAVNGRKNISEPNGEAYPFAMRETGSESYPVLIPVIMPYSGFYHVCLENYPLRSQGGSEGVYFAISEGV